MSEPGWYEKGRAALANWAAASRAGTWGSKESPLGRALDVVDAGDALVALVDAYFRDLQGGGGADPDARAWVESMAEIEKASAAYRAARSAR